MPKVISSAMPTGDEGTKIFWSRAELSHKLVGAGRGTRCPNVPVLQYILEIPGVLGATVGPYSAMVSIAPTFGWDEVEPRVLNLLNTLNLGEGLLAGTPDDEELESGFSLIVQRHNGSDIVRAVVRGPDGAIVARGDAVPESALETSKAQALQRFQK